MRQHIKTAAMIALAVVAMVMFITSLHLNNPQVSAAPAAIPTPIAQQAATLNPRVAVFSDGSASIAADAGTESFDLAGYNTLDLQWVVDQTLVESANNTTTLTLQFSNNRTNWVNGVAVVSATSSGDTGDLNQYHLFGRYARVYQDVTSSNPVTFTIIGVAK